MKQYFRLVGWLMTSALLLSSGLAYAATPRLKVSENRRYLQYEDGRSFFYLGDTAWELFHRLNREEATQYLTNRAQKGFTVIQAVALAQLGVLTVPNAYGDLPLADKDPTKPNDAYFRHVDFIVNKAEELGLVVGILPTWGSYWATGQSIFTPMNARQSHQGTGHLGHTDIYAADQRTRQRLAARIDGCGSRFPFAGQCALTVIS